MADLDEVIARMDNGFDRMEKRFDEINGRVRTTERDVAVLQDRSDRGGVLGALSGGAVGGILVAIKAWFDGGK